MSRRYTLEEIMALKPCYSQEQLEQYFPNGTITATQITEADVSHSDKLWVLVRLLKPADSVAFACDCAERVLHLFEERFPKDSRPRKAIAAARSGDKAAAWAAAMDAVEAAETAAAEAAAAAAEAAAAAAEAARAAAWAAEGAAAWATEAAGDAADAAARAAGAAEKKRQLKKLLQLIHDAEQSGNQPF